MALPIANAGAAPSDYPFSSLPIASVGLAGSGTPGTGATTITAYAWTMIDKPPGSAAALSATNVSNPNVLNIDSDGTVFLFLRVTDDLGQMSEGDPTKAPDSAFIALSVENELLELVKPAIGQRNWAQRIWDFVDACETLKDDFDTHTIADHIDTTATGAELNTLTGGSTTVADALHTHEVFTVLEAGLVETNTINGVSDPTSGVDIGMGEVTIRGKLNIGNGVAPVLLHNDYPNQATFTTGTDVLATYTVPAGTADEAGDSIIIYARWRLSANTNSKTVALRIAGAVVDAYTTTTSDVFVELVFRIDLVTVGPNIQRNTLRWSEYARTGGAITTRGYSGSDRADDYGANVIINAEASTATLIGDATLEKFSVTLETAV